MDIVTPCPEFAYHFHTKKTYLLYRIKEKVSLEEKACFFYMEYPEGVEERFA